MTRQATTIENEINRPDKRKLRKDGVPEEEQPIDQDGRMSMQSKIYKKIAEQIGKMGGYPVAVSIFLWLKIDFLLGGITREFG